MTTIRCLSIFSAVLSFLSVASANAADETMISANSSAFMSEMAARNFKEAGQYAAEALRLGEELYPPRDVKLVPLLRNYGMALTMVYRHDQAFLQYDRAMNIAEASDRVGVAERFNTQLDRAVALASSSKSDGADRAFLDLQNVADKSFGQDSL